MGPSSGVFFPLLAQVGREQAYEEPPVSAAFEVAPGAMGPFKPYREIACKWSST